MDKIQLQTDFSSESDSAGKVMIESTMITDMSSEMKARMEGLWRCLNQEITAVSRIRVNRLVFSLVISSREKKPVRCFFFS